MDLARVRQMALSRISSRTWRHTISLDPAAADRAEEAREAKEAAVAKLNDYLAQPPESKDMNIRGSEDLHLKELRAEVAATEAAAVAAQAAADEQSIYLEFKILTPDEYGAKLLQHADATGKFELEDFTLDVLASTYRGTFTGAGREGTTGEDVGISWDQVRGHDTDGETVVTHGELQALQGRVIEENRRIDSFPS